MNALKVPKVSCTAAVLCRALSLMRPKLARTRLLSTQALLNFEQGLLKLFEPVLERMAVSYRKSVEKSLRQYGLRYEDLYDPLLNQVLLRKRPWPNQRLVPEGPMSTMCITVTYSHAMESRMWMRLSAACLKK